MPCGQPQSSERPKEEESPIQSAVITSQRVRIIDNFTFSLHDELTHLSWHVLRGYRSLEHTLSPLRKLPPLGLQKTPHYKSNTPLV
jgi:hypothetical protein